MAIQRFLVGFAVMVAVALLVTVVTPLRAAAVQALAIVTCASASACTGGTNTSTGPGVQGTSAKGKGVVGQTKFNSTAVANGQNGILGQDLSTAGTFNTGVAGTSSRGTGVLGQSSAGTGLAGQSTSGNGVQGRSSGGTALTGLSQTGFALDAESKSNVAVFGAGAVGLEGDDVGGTSNDAILANGHGGNLIRANNRTGTNVFLLQNDGTATLTGDVIAGSVIAGSSGATVGVYGAGSSAGIEGRVGTTCAGFCAGVVGRNSGNSTTAVYADGHGGPLFVGNANSGSDVFKVDDAGNVHAHSFTADLAATRATSNGTFLETYSPEARSPTIEDFGEATLVGGQAYVHLDSTFASGIDHSRPYLVFITPQGAVGGTLYVTQKTSAGFAVRAETATVRPTVAFDYRIVARPYPRRLTASGVSHGTKSMPPMRQSITIRRTHSQSKKLPTH